MTGERTRPPLLTGPFLSVLALQVSYSAAMGCFVLLPKFLAVEFEATPAQIGWTQASFSLTNVLIVPLVGAGVDRLGRRTFLVLGSVLFTLSAIGFMQVDGVGPTVYLMRLIQGASWAFVYVSSATLIADRAPPARLSQALALFGACVHLVQGVMPPLAELASERWGWSTVFAVAAGCTLVTAALSANVARGRLADDPAASPAGLREVLRRPSLRRTIAVTAAVGVGVATLTTFIQPLAIERGVERVGGYFAAFSLMTVASRVLLGGWMDRADRHRIATISSLGYAVLLLAVIGLARSAPWMIGFGAVLGLAHGLYMPTFQTMNLLGVGPAERGKVVAILSGSLNAGVGLATAGLGVVAGQIGYAGIFPLAAAVTLIAPALLWIYPGGHRWSAAGAARGH